MANLIFGTLLAASLGQAAWIRLVSGSPEAWQLLGPRLVALLVVMAATVAVRRVSAVSEKSGFPVAAYSSMAFATLGLIAVVSYAAYYIVVSGGDIGWCLIAILCVIAQGLAMAPLLKARRRPEIEL